MATIGSLRGDAHQLGRVGVRRGTLRRRRRRGQRLGLPQPAHLVAARKVLEGVPAVLAHQLARHLEAVVHADTGGHGVQAAVQVAQHRRRCALAARAAVHRQLEAMLRPVVLEEVALRGRSDHHTIAIQVAEAIADAPDVLDQARHEAEEQRVRQELAALGPVLARATAV